MLISPAYAQTAGSDPTSTLTSFIPLVLILVVFYFLLIRPQQRKAKEHKGMLDALRRGDRVVTSGGIVGLVTKVTAEEREVTVEIAEGVRVKVMRDMIVSVLSKTEPVEAKVDKKEIKSELKKLPSGKDPFAILGLSKGASTDEIKSAYRKLVKNVHPDTNPDDEIAQGRFQEIQAAYEALTGEQAKNVS